MMVTISSMGDMCYGDGTGLKQRGQSMDKVKCPWTTHTWKL